MGKILRFEYDGQQREYYFIQGIKPILVVVLHPYGGSATETIKRYPDLQDEGFSLLLPEGIQGSWNGGECCGFAKDNNIDDLGFISTLAQHILQEKFQNKIQAYISGFSNGAFMTSKLALNAIDKGELWIKGIAMNAGYNYDPNMYIEAEQKNGVFSFPVFAAHGSRDPTVKIQGCCSKTKCCCEITSPNCISFYDTYLLWSKINQCKGTEEFKGEKMKCYRGVQCEKSVEFCELIDEVHFSTRFSPLNTNFFLEDINRSSTMDGSIMQSSLSSGILVVVGLVLSFGFAIFMRQRRQKKALTPTYELVKQ